MPLIFIWIVKTVIITITYVNTRNAVPIITCEQIAKAGPAFRLAVLWWFIRPISAIIVTVTIPCCWDTSMIWAPAQIAFIYLFIYFYYLFIYLFVCPFSDNVSSSDYIQHSLNVCKPQCLGLLTFHYHPLSPTILTFCNLVQWTGMRPHCWQVSFPNIGQIQSLNKIDCFCM
jgi:hypothetical protein